MSWEVKGSLLVAAMQRNHLEVYTRGIYDLQPRNKRCLWHKSYRIILSGWLTEDTGLEVAQETVWSQKPKRIDFLILCTSYG